MYFLPLAGSDKEKQSTGSSWKAAGRMRFVGRERFTYNCSDLYVCRRFIGGTMLIFPRVRMTEQLKIGAPPDSLFSCNPTGWMNAKEFCKWFDHFIKHTRPTPENPVLLLLDGHSSHTKNLAFVEKARASNVTVISFPPHCTHKMQPLDVSYMASLKSHLSKAEESFLKKHPGKTVTINDISTLFGKAFLASAIPASAINGFIKTGVSPYNRSVFGEDDFAAANVSDIPLTTEGESADACGEPSVGENVPVESSDLLPTTMENCPTPADVTEPPPIKEDQFVNQSNAMSIENDALSFFGFNENEIGESPVNQHFASVLLKILESSSTFAPKKEPIQIPEPNAKSAFKVSPAEVKPLPKMAFKRRSHSRNKERSPTSHQALIAIC